MKQATNYAVASAYGDQKMPRGGKVKTSFFSCKLGKLSLIEQL